MSESVHNRASEVFLAARKLPQERRSRFLDEACGADTDLRAEVESLLEFDQPTPAFMRADGIGSAALHSAADRAARDSRRSAPDGDDVRKARPDRLADYDILDTLGEGGMGIVYLAQQHSPRRRVALKVIRSAWVSARAIRRFEHEAEALARLSHPAIAQMYEARLSGEGDVPPFIAMEYVAGEPLPTYAHDSRHTVRQRLELTARICDAVEHAHQRGVIHRDLKPGNILVTSEGAPKVLDFGIARLCDDADRLRTLHTQTGELVGTLPYMSPEQVEGKSHELDTRTDVYALGLLLYELLADRPALDLSNQPVAQAARIIREQEPPSLGSLDRRWRGDIETIVAKAIEKDRARRYQSVGEMAADIRRFLADRPIQARPASRLYQFRKFARRNRAIVAGVSLALVAMMLGTALAAWQAMQAADSARRAQATSDFLRGIFAAIDPYRVGPEVTVAEIVRDAEDNVASVAQGQPLLEADLRCELGSIYFNLGLLAEAQVQFSAADRIRRDRLGASDPLTLDVCDHLGLLRSKQGRYAEAEALLQEALAGRADALGDDHPATLRTMNNLAEAIHAQGRFREAATLCEAALGGQSQLLGEAHPDTLATKVNLASAYRALGRRVEAESAYDQAIPQLRATMGPHHPLTLFAMGNLARLYKDDKRYAEAVPLQREAYAGMRAALGDDHPDTLIAAANLAQMLWRGGKPAEAEPIYRDVITRMSVVFGEDHAHVVTVSTQLALALEAQGKLDEARTLLLKQLEWYRRLYGVDHLKTIQIQDHLTRVTRKLNPTEVVGANAIE